MAEIIGVIVIGAILFYLLRGSFRGGGMMGGCCGGGHTSAHNPGHSENPHQRSAIRDPVCGMPITEGTEAATIDYHGKTFYFCSSECKGQFEKNPERYIINRQKGKETS